MGISDKMNQIVSQIQDGVKTSSISLVALSLKILTAAFLGLTFSIIVQEIMSSGTFAFVFCFLIVFSSFFKLMAKWSIANVLLFDLFCILTSLLLKLYLQIAP